MNQPIKLAVPVNTTVLLQLADAQTAKVFTELGGELPSGVKEAVEKVQGERKAKAAEAAANEIVNLVEGANNFLAAQAMQKVTLQKQIEAIDTMAAKVLKAVKFGAASSNYLPLAKLTGQGVPSAATKELLSVPDDWVEPTVQAAAAITAPAA